MSNHPRRNCKHCKGTGYYTRSKIPCKCIDGDASRIPKEPVKTKYNTMFKNPKAKTYIKNRTKKIYKTTNDEAIQNIDIALIKSLKLRGLYDEADAMIKDHQRLFKE